MNTYAFEKKVLGCWMGKNIGGTLGAPMEWYRQVNDVSFYTQELGGEPLPNDDLDIQLLWLVAMEQQGIDIDAKTLGDYWMLYVTPHWAEYGNAKINMRSGLLPPLSGALNNIYRDSCGCFIRAEIWACICPGNPLQAARYALEDAAIDHGRKSEGAYSAAFVAAMEAAAFVESDVKKLLDIGLSYIPADSACAGAVGIARAAHATGKTWLEARDEVLKSYASADFFLDPNHTSREDREKGFNKGPFGWEVPANMGMLAIGLLYGEGDFSDTICIAVNCGEDTDCTGATAGAIFGIIAGIEGIPEKWIAPVGHGIKTISINAGDLQGGQIPPTVENLTDRTVNLAKRVALDPRKNVSLSLTALDPKFADGSTYVDSLYEFAEGPVYRTDFLDIYVSYPKGPWAQPWEETEVLITLINTYKFQTRARVELLLPEILTSESGLAAQAFLSPPNWRRNRVTFPFTLTCDGDPPPVIRAAAVVTLDGHVNAQAVPIVLLGNEKIVEEQPDMGK